MRYMKKTPAEAIQWKGDNQQEVFDFLHKTIKKYHLWDDDYGNLHIVYEYVIGGRRHDAVVPKFGWVVREDKTFQFYRDSTFRKTFEEVQDDDSKSIDWEGLNKTIKEAFNGFDEVFKDFKDVFGAEPSKETLDAIKMRARIDTDGRLTKLIDGLYRDDEKTRKEIKKNLSDGLKEMASSDTNKATFESVLDEMKELHAKKDKDYGSAFHKSFEEFGITAGVVRLNDKMERMKSLVKNGKAEVKDESFLDSLKDAACYAVMLYVELRNKEND